MKIYRLTKQLSLILVFCALMAGCKVQLAPAYDQAIVDGTTKSTQQVMKLLSSVSQGTDKATFDEREDAYDEVIGAFDALAVQSRARPIPNEKVLDKANAALEKRGLGALTDNYPSAAAFERISQEINGMKLVDKSAGLNSDQVDVFKIPIRLSLDQAITYESHLKR